MCHSDAAKAGDGPRDAPASASRDAAGPGGCFDSEEISRETRRDADFSRLDRAGVAYCDHAGAPPYAESLVRECASALTSTLLGNPHSAHDAAGATSAAVDAARDATLEHFNAPLGEYAVVFTSGATAAMRLLAESFPWSPESEFAYTRVNHTSVLGIRACAAAAGARVACVDVVRDDGDDDDGDVGDDASGASSARRTNASRDRRPGLRLRERAEISAPRARPGPSRAAPVVSLFAYPSECNLTGERFDPALASSGARRRFSSEEKDRSGGQPVFLTLCDAAKSAGLDPPDLSAPDAPDFLACSFYKMFGYPSGVGALVARTSALALLKPRYFGGGTAAGVDADEAFYARRDGAEGLEDGTLPFSSLLAVPRGFEWLAKQREPGETSGGSRAGAKALDRRARAVAARAAAGLAALRHANGRRVVRLYGAGWLETQHRLEEEVEEKAVEEKAVEAAVEASVKTVETASRPPPRPPPGVVSQGPVVAFNVLRSDGAWTGYARVERALASRRVSVRVGCCCNPGACARLVGAAPGGARRLHASGKTCGDGVDLDDEGNPTGVVRASFGPGSVAEDADRLVEAIQEHFAEEEEEEDDAKEVEAAEAEEKEDFFSRREGADAGVAPLEGAADAGVVARPLGTFIGTSLVARVTSLAVYPIKSAAAFEPPAGSWPIGPNGLLYDREWALVTPAGAALCARRVPALARLRCAVDLARGVATVRMAPSDEDGDGDGDGGGGREAAVRGPSVSSTLILPLRADDAEDPFGSGSGSGSGVRVRLCGEETTVARGASEDADADAEGWDRASRASASVSASASASASASSRSRADAWFTAALGVACALVRQRPGTRRAVASGVRGGPNPRRVGLDDPRGDQTRPSIGLANSAQILLVSAASVADLRDKAARRNPGTSAADLERVVHAARFRPNVVVGPPEALEAYAEETDAWKTLHVRGYVGEGDREDDREGEGDRDDAKKSGRKKREETDALALRAVRRCERCSTVGVDHRDGARTPEPMRTLVADRGKRGGGGGGGVSFGVLFNVAGDPPGRSPPRERLGSARDRAAPGAGASDGEVREWMIARWGRARVVSVGDAVRPGGAGGGGGSAVA